MHVYYGILYHEVSLQTGEYISIVKLIQRSLGTKRTVVLTYDENPLLNTMIYEVDFPNGDVKDYVAKIISENILTQVDSEGTPL